MCCVVRCDFSEAVLCVPRGIEDRSTDDKLGQSALRQSIFWSEEAREDVYTIAFCGL